MQQKKEQEQQEQIDGLLEKERLLKYAQFHEWESKKLDRIRAEEKSELMKSLTDQLKNK